VPASVQEVTQAPGRPLDASTRQFMEPRFGYDFSRVRVHTDARAAASADAVDARAYSVGSNIAFAANEYEPTTQRGRDLIAHELAHTIQQSRGTGRSASRASTSDGHERAADAASAAVMRGANFAVNLSPSEVGLARKPADIEERAAAVAEAEATVGRIDEELAEEGEHEDPAATQMGRPRRTRSRFDPGGFTDTEAAAVLGEAQDRLKLGSMALVLAERQARRRAFWDRNPSYTDSHVREAHELDMYWDPSQESFVRWPYVSNQERLVLADPDARRLYSDRLWDLTENKAVKKGRFARAMGFVCKHTEPCSSNQEHIRRDIEGGMSREEAIHRGMARTVFFGATMALPGKGPSGPIQIGPRVRPATTFGEPATATPRFGPAERPATPVSDPIMTTGGKSGGPPRAGKAPAEEGAIPEATADAPTGPIKEGTPSPYEVVGEYRILGSKGLKGKTFEREIWGLEATVKPTTQRGTGPVKKFMDDLIGEAKAAGASELRIVGQAVGNRFIRTMRRTVEARGGRFTRVDAVTVEMVVPVPK
jgi:hypothetical protein